MDILIFSDSHGRADAMQRVLDRQITPPDAICFLGDGLRDTDLIELQCGAFYGVRGNCDWSIGASDIPTERVVEWSGHRALLTHGHEYGVKSGLGRLLLRARELGVGMVLFGHTHEPICQRVEGDGDASPILLFNPGSIGMNGSFGVLTVRGGNLLFSHGQL